MDISIDSPPAELKTRKAIGRAFLEADRVEEALQTYARILRDYPEDIESYLFLGDWYFMDGNWESALLFYKQALALHPGDSVTQRRIFLAEMETNNSPEAQPQPVASVSAPVRSKLQQLLGNVQSISDEDVARAAKMLEEIVSSQQPARAVAERLDEIDELVPALLELNIRQAKADGRPDLAQGLQELLAHIHSQLDGRRPGILEKAAPKTKRLPRVLFLDSQSGENSLRQMLPAAALGRLGCKVMHCSLSAAAAPPEFQADYDVIVAHQPHGNPTLLHSLAAAAAANIPIVLDLETDFEQMPLAHPSYAALGLGTQASARAYTASLLLARLVCVPNEQLAAYLRSKGCRVKVIPDGWSRENELWEKPAPRRSTIHLGWIGQPGEVEDVAQVRRIVLRILREFPQVGLVVVGDPQVYRLFETVSETRRLFLPPVRLEDHPYLLRQIDILLAPLRNTPFNQMISDWRLLEAGIRGIPWIASPAPAFTSWGAGGLIANSAEEWHSHMRQLILEENVRSTLGEAGRAKAGEREMQNLGKAWLELVQEALETDE